MFENLNILVYIMIFKIDFSLNDIGYVIMLEYIFLVLLILEIILIFILILMFELILFFIMVKVIELLEIFEMLIFELMFELSILIF